jgi:hypothetical protein
MTRDGKRIGIAIVTLLAAIQLWPARRTNPPVSGEIVAPPEVRSILRRSCYNCHSNETRWSWYSRLAPFSWLIVHDVNGGRRELNLSQWDQLTPARQAMAPQRMLDKIETGAMPLPRYLRLHDEARLSPQDIETIRRWVEEP